MSRIIYFVILFFSTQVLYSQEYKSIHATEYELHLTEPLMPSEFDPEGKEIIPLQFDKSKSLDVTIFGYLPDWEYQTAKPYLRYDILTHIAAFDFVVDSLGGVTNPSYWPWTDVINAAHTNGVKIILCAVNFSGSQIHQIMTIPTAKQVFFSNVLAKMQQYQLDGINIDFEALLTSDRGDEVNGFMSDLSAYIKAVVPTAEISFAGPAVNWSSWKLQGLADACDYIFIMGYDFYGSWSTTTGPSAPFLGGSYNIYNTVNTQYASPTATTPHKLVLGVPYYGCKWLSRSGEINSPVIKYIGSTRFTTDQPNSQIYGLQWAGNYRVPWYRWQNNDTSWYQVWFDNDSSLGIKYALAQSKNYKGVGMWALGYDKGRNELWDELYERFYQTSGVDLITSEPGFKLSQNYPNPFNPETLIEYQIDEDSFVSLKVFDILGNLIEEVLNEKQNAGNYRKIFRANNLPSGVYIYQLTTDKYSTQRRMLLLK